MKNNNAIIMPTKALLILFFIICISILIYICFIGQDVQCALEDKVELMGVLRIGFDITINACFRHDTTVQSSHYDLVDCFINEVE